MLTKSFTGTWIPAWVPESPKAIAVLLLLCSIVQSATAGYDSSMVNGLNILPSYTDYFVLTPALLGLQTASIFIGAVVCSAFSGVLADRLGRRPTIFWGSLVTAIGVILQASARNTAMFAVARMILGGGTTIAAVGSVAYLSETFTSEWRAWGLGALDDFYYVGAIIAAGVTYATSSWTSTWAWRAPSLIQGIFCIMAIVLLPFVPESPRWLVHRGHLDAAKLVLAQIQARGDTQDSVVQLVYNEIVDTLTWEREQGRTISPRDLFTDRKTLKRLMIGTSTAVFATAAGNIIAGFFLGQELATAGITNYVSQLKANIVLNSWAFVCAIGGTHLCHKWGRRPTALVTQALCTIMLFIIGGLTKAYAADPGNASSALIYGNVGSMFLFQGFYSIGWTPLASLYPPEIFNYAMRSNGVACTYFVTNLLSALLVFVMPIGITNIGYWMYLTNAIWDVGSLVLIYLFWPETKGKTIEEMDALFYGEAHTTMPNLEEVRRAMADRDGEMAVDHLVHTDTSLTKSDEAHIGVTSQLEN